MTLIITSRTLVLISAAAMCLLIAGQQGLAAKSEPLTQATTSLLSKTLPAQTRTRQSRSLSDMFEKVKSKLFGSRKQGQVAGVNQQMQASASSNVAAIQRQPWNDINSFNQQYSPMVGYQNWPQASAQGNQFLQQPYSSMNSYMPQTGSPGSFQQAPSSQASILSLDQPQQQQQQQQPIGGISSAVGGSQAETGGLLASASQLFTRFMSPNSGASNSNVQQANQQQASQVSPQQQQQQNQYNEFASILDSMVAQTGVSNQRQPSQYQSAIQQPQMPQGFQSAQIGDNDMSGSSNIQSYLPVSGAGASQAQAGAKSSMVSLAEQLAPGAAFNKLVSFPFSLTNNEDPTKEGKYKLHIPFLNQHVKRSDQQAASSAALSQQQQRFAQQYLNSLINQQYLSTVANAQAPQQQQHLMAQPSQVNGSPQFQQSLTSGTSAASQSVSSLTASQAAAPVASSNSASSLLSAASSNPISTSSQVINSSNPSGRQSWSVADSQSSAASSSKLIPISSSSSLESASASATQS